MKVFISYSRHDESAVRSIVSDLRRAQLNVWLDEDLGGGDAWWSEILEQIRGCTVFLFASSDNSLHSKPCKAELGYAQALGLPILPVQIGEISSYRAHQIFSRQLIDYREPAAATGFALMGALHEQGAHRGELPDPLPDGPAIPYEYLQRLGESIHDAAVLTPSVQAQMLFELRNALTEEDDSTVLEDIRTLLGVLRRRTDVTYPVATEIDTILRGGVAEVSPTPVAPPAEDIPPVGAQLAEAPASPATTQSAQLKTTQSAELKQVTVLVASVVDSMNIAAALGVERFREIITELVDRSAAVVQRYGGVVDKGSGEGVTAVFGAPAALEDHALRGCLAALGIQDEAKRLAGEVGGPDRVDLQLRIGVNSGQVIAGEMGSGSLGLVGDQAGMAQRMESVAPPGGVMLSGSTARLVENTAVLLGEPELVQIGAAAPMPARRLLGVASQPGEVGRFDSTLVGRQWEMNTITGILDRVGAGHGCVVCVGGPPGIGKSRLVHEAAEIARGHGVEVFETFCESHASDISFHVIARLLRAIAGISDLDDAAARARLRSRLPVDVDPQDLVLLDDLLGIRDPGTELPPIDPAARRRRLTALVNAVSLARTEPVIYILEDAHWIDAVSESMLTGFLTVIPQTPSIALITYRPYYHGALAQVPGAQTVALAPLGDADISALIGELVGPDPSVGAVAALITERTAGNPFFAEEMVRELAERGVLEGERGHYLCHTDVAEVSVPATVQAVIAARIDRLEPGAKQTLSAAAVIGSQFGPELLTILGIDPALEALVEAEMIDQVRFAPRAEYVFRHPLIRAVAYESQLKPDRAKLHRSLAAAIEAGDPAAVDENASLIAENLEAAGDVQAAYGWHMRAGAWSMHRDMAAARLSWERAREIADALPTDDPGRTGMRIAPRTQLCGTAWRVHAEDSALFDELRELSTLAGDKASLAMAMAGQVMNHWLHARVREASALASELMALIESVADPTMTVGLSFNGDTRQDGDR